jgi:hypothetical protein
MAANAVSTISWPSPIGAVRWEFSPSTLVLHAIIAQRHPLFMKLSLCHSGTIVFDD